MSDPSFHSSQWASKELLSDARRGDPAALDALCRRIQTELAEIARAVLRRRGGSPDGGVHGESDLAQSVAVLILNRPAAKLADVHTSEQLRARLYRLFHDRWIERRRAATRQKRGGGKVRQASQLGRPEDSSPLNVADRGFGAMPAPTTAEVAADMQDVLGAFASGSEVQRILLMLMEGCTQQEIGDALGLSRDAVGRRIRQTIAPTLARIMKPESDA